MVRFSELMKAAPALPKPPAGPPALGRALTPEIAQSIVRSSRATPPRPPTPSESQALHDRLLQECRCCLEAAQAEQPLTLGAIPALIEQVIQRLSGGDQQLPQLSTMGGQPFSLAAHSVNVAILAIGMGLELGMKPPALAELGIAALLHDLGMTQLSHLLPLPSHLSPEQLEQLRRHPLWGEQIAQRCAQLPPSVREVIAQEHERIDGSGYPRRLAGGAIHEHAQLIGLLDVYEALTHERPHRRRLLPAQAARAVIEEHHAAFRRELLRAFLRSVPLFPVESWVRLSSGDLAQVVATSAQRPLSPTVSLRFDALLRPYARPRTIDLGRDPDLAIVEAIPAPMTP